MKEAVTSFDLIAVVEELQDIVGGHIDKIYQEGEDFFIKVNVPGGGRREIYLRPGKWLCVKEGGEKPETPPPFAQALRRHIPNASIRGVSQHGFDRVVTFNLETDRSFQLVFELFSGGNIVLVEDGRTVLCQHTRVYRNRQIKVGQKYAFPPEGVDPIDLDREEFQEILRGSKAAVVKVLASNLNLGGLYAEELCLVAGVDGKSKASALPEEQLDGLFTALNNLIAAVQQDRRPALILRDGGAVDAVPIDLQTYAGDERTLFSTFSEALSSYLDSVKAPEESREPSQKELISARFQRRLEQQEESLAALRAEAAKHELHAQFLFSHFQEFEELLKAVREGREPRGTEVMTIDHERRTVTVGIGEGDSIELDYRKDVNGNAQILYKKRRDAHERGARVESAMEETRREMGAALKRAKKVAEVTGGKPTKKFWFETYRWFISSEGFLVIAGRDARSNESLVRKHLKAGDRYAHASAHGAPSVVIKDGAKAGEATLREACAFAVNFSKAWSSKLASGSAYWVNPEQVSKTAESGEYIPKGAFVIRGKRNYHKDLEIRVAVGEIEHQGHRKIMAGPESAVTSVSRCYAILEPGDVSKEDMANRFARVFKVPSEEVSRIMPPGPVRVRKLVGIELH